MIKDSIRKKKWEQLQHDGNVKGRGNIFIFLGSHRRLMYSQVVFIEQYKKN